jgi:ribosome-binding factor A
MPSHRPERIAEAIREVVATSILFELNDPRIRGVTVLRSEVAPDLRSASVYVTLMGTEAERKQALRALRHAAGFLQSKVADRLQTRYTPRLTFKVDEGVKSSVAVSRLIDEALAEDAARHPPGPPSELTGPPGDDRPA